MEEAMCTNPLVSFCLKSYNQKQYLIEALKGAFAQTYRPLEIVISDDGSTDGSWEYIQQAVADFRHEHPDVAVVINRNEPNLGNLGNWQKCCELAHGELFVKADGDDISFPDRTERIVESWLKKGKRAKIIVNEAVQIDAKGRLFSKKTDGHLRGAYSAYARELFERFNCKVDYPRGADDACYIARARLLDFGNDDAILRIPDVLVNYRVGTGVSTVLFNLRTPYVSVVPMEIMANRQAFVDLRWLTNGISCGKRLCELKEFLVQERRRCLDLYVLGGGNRHNTMRNRCLAFKRLQRVQPTKKLTPWYFMQVVLLIPSPLSDFCLWFYAILNFCRKKIVCFFSV